MAYFKGTMFFAQGQSGWTEQFYLVSETANAALDSLRQLAEPRAGLLGAGAELVRFEVSRVGSWRRTLSSAVQTRPFPYPAGRAGDGVLFQFQVGGTGDSPAYRRTWLMRGCPAGFTLIGDSSKKGVNPTVAKLVQSWLKVLASGRYFLQVADKTTAWHPIADILPGAFASNDVLGRPLQPGSPPAGSTVLHLRLGDGAFIPPIDPETASNSKVFVRNVRWSPASEGIRARINGEHVVASTLPGVVTFRSDIPLTGSYAGSGFLTLRHEIYQPIERAIPLGQGQRKCGRAPVAQTLFERDVIPPLPPEPVLPPPPPANPPPWGPFPNPTVINDALDLVNYLYQGYDKQADGKTYPVLIAPVQEKPNTWLVTCSGTELGVDAATGIPQDIAAALLLPSSYTAGLADAIVSGTQPGATLIVAGHSLGGMVLENAIWYGIPSDRTVSHCLTYGSPLTIGQSSGVAYRMFALPLDFVVDLSPMGALMRLLGHPEQTYLDPGDISINPITRHTSYTVCQDLRNWSPLGEPMVDPERQKITLGAVQRFSLPRLTI